MGAAGGTVLKVNRMAAVQVCALRDAKRIARPHRTGRINHVKPERFRMLAEAVDVRGARQRRPDAEELRFKDEGMICGREKHVARAGARDIKREWSGAIRESDMCRIGPCLWVRRGPREDRVGDFVACAIRVGYLEMDACFWGWWGVCIRQKCYPCPL